MTTLTTALSELAEIELPQSKPDALPDDKIMHLQVRDIYRYLSMVDPALNNDQKAVALGVIFGSPPSAIDPAVLDALGQVVEMAKRESQSYAGRINDLIHGEVVLKYTRIRVVTFAMKTLTAAMYFFAQLGEEDKVEVRRVLQAGLDELD